MSGSDAYSWIGGTSGTWGTASNWEDLTTGSVAATAPGIDNAATISDFVSVSGLGSAATLSILGSDTVLGDINTGGLVLPGDVLLSVLDGGSIQASTISLNSAVVSSIDLDTNSAFEIGNAGSAAAGALTIDPGATLSGALRLSGNLIDNGLVASSDLLLTDLGPVVSGNGTVEALAGGMIYLDQSVTSSGLSFQLDGGALLSIDGASIPASNTITMSGSANTLGLVGEALPTYGEPTLPSIGATLYGLDATDQIIFQGLSFNAASYASGLLDLLQGTSVVDTLAVSGNYIGDLFAVSGTFSAGLPEEIVTVGVACFAAGTCIATPNGEVAVEALRRGDAVSLAAGGTAPIVWIGHRRVNCAAHPQPRDMLPVCIRRGAFAPAIPARDLLLSPDHAVFVDDVLIPIKYLANGTSIRQVAVDEVVYYHIELPRHDVVLAEGLPAESYLDTGDRSDFTNGGDVIRLFPDFPTGSQDTRLIWEAYGCAPLIVTGPEVAAVRQRLEKQMRLAGRNRTRIQAIDTAKPARLSRRP